MTNAALVMGEVAQANLMPEDQRARARCIVVIPSLMKVGLVVGARHGYGVVSCRIVTGWSAPALIQVAGGSAGLQAGVQSADIVMVLLSERMVGRLFQESFQLSSRAWS